MILGIDASRANVLQRTGTEWYSYFLIREFLSIFGAEEVRLYTKSPLVADFPPLPQSWSVHALSWPPRFLWTHLRLSAEMLVKRPDLLFVPAHTIPLVHPKKVVTTIHDIGFEHERQLYNQKTVGATSSASRGIWDILARAATLGKYSASELDYHRFSARFAVVHATKIITVSEFTKQEIIKTYNADPEKIVVVHNGYNSEIFTPLRNSAREKVAQEAVGCGQSYVISIGRLEYKKNTPRLVEAFGVYVKQHPESTVRLVLVGSQGFGFDEVAATIKKFNLKQRVCLPGWVEASQYVDLLRGAQAFIFPSLYEGFGIPLLEAMASGVPVIASQTTSIPEVVGDAAVLVDPQNTSDIADALHKLMSHQDARHHLRERGLERVKQFSWKAAGQKTAHVLREVMT